jgi:hypothetical protein
MISSAAFTFNSITEFPVPECAGDNSVAFSTGQADELLGFVAPCYSVEVPRSSTETANKPPVPITPRIITGNVSCRLTQRIFVIQGMDQFTIFAGHQVRPTFCLLLLFD